MLHRPEILTTCRFYLGLTLDSSQKEVDCHFLECRGFQQTQAAIEICEVTPQLWGVGGNTKGRTVRTKLPSNSKSGNITLRRGMTKSKELWDWFADVRAGNWSKQRRLAALSIYDQASKEVARFELVNAWPVSYKFADLNARSTDIEIEEVEIAFEEFRRVK